MSKLQQSITDQLPADLSPANFQPLVQRIQASGVNDAPDSDTYNVHAADIQDGLVDWLRSYSERIKCKIASCSFDSLLTQQKYGDMKLCDRVWLELDILPMVSFVNERKFSSFGEQAIMDRTTVETLVKQQLVMSIYDNFEIPG